MVSELSHAHVQYHPTSSDKDTVARAFLSMQCDPSACEYLQGNSCVLLYVDDFLGSIKFLLY